LINETMRPTPANKMTRSVQTLLCALFLTLTVTACMAPAVIETVPEAEHAEEPPAALPPSEPDALHSQLAAIQYTIQVGAFSTVERAAAYAAGLIRQGVDAYYFIDADGLCKVRFERFDSKEAARQRAAWLQAAGFIDAFYIAQPRPDSRAVNPRESLRKNIIQTASRFIGTPYRWGGESVQNGFDCSGLTMTVYRLNGLDLPRNSRAQFRAGTPIQRAELQVGDLVFFATTGKGRVSHVGLYSGGGRFIHAPGPGKRIRISSLSSRYFDRRFLGARRYF
jgi:cell wall-associated NlpC family hydrolase